jgi:hypothetical protein
VILNRENYLFKRITIYQNERVNGHAFLKLTEEKLIQDGMKRGPASNLAVFAKECKEK